MSFWDFLARPLYFQDHLFMWSHKSVLPGIKLCIMAKHTMVAPINAIWGTTDGSYGPVLRVTTRSNWLKGYSDSNILTRCHSALDHGFNLHWNIPLTSAVRTWTCSPCVVGSGARLLPTATIHILRCVLGPGSRCYHTIRMMNATFPFLYWWSNIFW